MEPVRLQLQNFLSYREGSVNLEPVSLACLVGENGAGKSSLLDAVTWALFGQGTKGGIRELDNYVTRGETEGRVELEFRLNGSTYRVVRGRSIARNKSTLEFYILDGQNWRSLSGKSIADTQKIIEDTLRMDYRTFTASSLILQGKADSFTADMTDAERKEALARILGLDRWDRLQERAKEVIRGLTEDLKASDVTRDRLEKQIAHEEEFWKKRDSLVAQLEEQSRIVESLNRLVTELQVKLSMQPVLEQAVTEASAAVQRTMEREIRNIQARDNLARQMTAAESAIQKCQEILSRREEIEEAAALEADMARDVAEFDAQARRHLELTNRAMELERKVTDFDKALEANIARCKARIEALRPQVATMERVPCGEEDKAACPLLANARKAAEEISRLEAELTSLQKEVNPHRQAWAEAVKAREALQYDPAAHEAARQALEDVRRTARLKPELDAATKRVEELRVQQEGIRREITRLEAEAEEIRRERSEAEQRMKDARQVLDGLAPVQRELSDQKIKLAQARAAEAQLRTDLGRVQADLDLIEKAKAELKAIEEQTEALRADLTVYEILEQACGKKAGVPALIVENAVPEIERLANDMLGKMAGGRLSVRLDTQAEGKTTGTMQEVLRITVREGGMERPYQTYSGAERFMVDLALRVALSKFLAHRAGAEIRLFVLDEGLGCADAANRTAILSAIMAVSEEFSKVLVVTHLDELKDAFPQRVEVTKGADGSRVRIVA